MALVLSLLAIVGGLASFVCSILILIHAFKQSVGTGFMTLCIPCYILYYGFSVFEHEKKNLILGVWIGGWVLSVAMNLAARGMMGSGAGF